MNDPDERWMDAVDKKLDRYDERITGVESFQKWQIGAAGVIMYIVGLLSDKIRALFGH